eukprot:1192552-Prorocentrum_minimum.AAC.3
MPTMARHTKLSSGMSSSGPMVVPAGSSENAKHSVRSDRCSADPHATSHPVTARPPVDPR